MPQGQNARTEDQRRRAWRKGEEFNAPQQSSKQLGPTVESIARELCIANLGQIRIIKVRGSVLRDRRVQNGRRNDAGRPHSNAAGSMGACTQIGFCVAECEFIREASFVGLSSPPPLRTRDGQSSARPRCRGIHSFLIPAGWSVDCFVTDIHRNDDAPHRGRASGIWTCLHRPLHDGGRRRRPRP